ncbi:MAG: hypothetical protein R3F29_11150 [Planctomycetota bacterium]
MKDTLSLALAALATSLTALSAQSNAVPGRDINVFEVGSPTIYRTGAPYPNGTAGVVIGHSMGNCGTVDIPWQGYSGSQLIDQHVKIAFLLARESGGRMVQISGKSHCKHSRTAFNFSGSNPCGPCQSGPSGTFHVGCYDVYGSGFNGNQSVLGPTTEIDPWLGTWNPIGSYFDIGDPIQANYPQPADGVSSISTTGFTPVRNRMEVDERDLAASGTFYGQDQVVILGEPVANRDNNLVSRPMSFTFNGTSWSGSLGTGTVHGSVLTRWTGATTSLGGNGNDDGRFLVAVKVTGPVNGMWHYEYAVHNLDNHRGGASLRIPVCTDARIENIGFHDIDHDPLSDWQIARSGGELQFLATANNPLDWNTFYNFYFDSDAAPIAGNVSIDEARLGPGALFVDVATTVPGLLGAQFLGAGCGAPAPKLAANGVPASPNPGFALDLTADQNSAVVLAFATQAANVPLGSGCTLLIDDSAVLTSLLLTTDATGHVSYAVPVPPGLAPTELAAQAFAVVPGGPLLGFLAVSNGLLVRAASTGCP